MNTILIIISTIIVDAIFGLAFKAFKKRELKRNEDVFIFKLTQILENESIDKKKRIEQAKALCRMTEGNLASSAYIALDCIF